MRWAKWIGGAVWAGSWYLMYLEITRWRHVKPSLAFNSDLEPVNGMKPRPGLPLILLYVACAAAPLTFAGPPLLRLLRRAGAGARQGRR